MISIIPRFSPDLDNESEQAYMVKDEFGHYVHLIDTISLLEDCIHDTRNDTEALVNIIIAFKLEV